MKGDFQKPSTAPLSCRSVGTPRLLAERGGGVRKKKMRFLEVHDI